MLGVFGYDVDGVAYGVASLDNSGSISATATSGDYSAYSIAQATGASVVSLVNGYVDVNNAGSISATASSMIVIGSPSTDRPPTSSRG